MKIETPNELIKAASKIPDHDPPRFFGISTDTELCSVLKVNHFLLRSARDSNCDRSIIKPAQTILCEKYGWKNMFAPEASDVSRDQARKLLSDAVA